MFEQFQIDFSRANVKSFQNFNTTPVSRLKLSDFAVKEKNLFPLRCTGVPGTRAYTPVAAVAKTLLMQLPKRKRFEFLHQANLK